MIISLISIMEAENASIHADVPIDFDEIRRKGTCFPVEAEKPISVTVTHLKGRKYHISASGCVKATIPCDRCLVPVEVQIPIDIDEITDAENDDSSDDHDEMPYLEGYNLDAGMMIRSEIAIGWPVKTLCKESCLGICKSCGANRNLEPCGCEDFTPDPRMAAIQDIFKKAKEV